ncbi:hypothetical protein QL285_075784 [Trifolium repens]|nr:hypothetical protein QL285_075784 [Trifolium repens]
MSLNPVENEPSIAYPSIGILIQQIRQTKQCPVQCSQVLGHHERVYSLTCLTMSQTDNLFLMPYYLSAKSNAQIRLRCKLPKFLDVSQLH